MEKGKKFFAITPKLSVTITPKLSVIDQFVDLYIFKLVFINFFQNSTRPK